MASKLLSSANTMNRPTTDLILGLALHDHDLPGQVADDAGRGQRRVFVLAEVLHLFKQQCLMRFSPHFFAHL